MSVNVAFNGIGNPLPGVVKSSMPVAIVFLPLAFHCPAEVLNDNVALTG